MRCLIDAISMSHPQPGGYRTYTTNLVRHLQLADQHNDYVVAVDRPISWVSRPRWQLEVLRRRGSIGAVMREQFAIPRLSHQWGVDLIHSPSATAPLRGHVPQVVTLYDTIEFSEPLPSPWQTRRWAMRLYSRLAQAGAARRARHIITISQYSKAQISCRFSIPDEKITVVYLAPSPVFSRSHDVTGGFRARKCLGLSGYVLGIASAARRKNTGALLAAYARLPDGLRRQHPLVLVCTHPGVKGRISATAQGLGVGDHVVLVEEVSDRDLASLYSAAVVFVYPSLEEGFGLPPLEAMASGTPVIASNTSSIPEVVMNAGLLVAPTDVAEIGEAIGCVLTNRVLADDLRARGEARAKTFSWMRVAHKTREIYERAASEGS